MDSLVNVMLFLIIVHICNLLRDCLIYFFIISQVVDKTTNEAEIILQYVKNTHAATHNTYTLEVEDVSFLEKSFFKCIVFVNTCM